MLPERLRKNSDPDAYAISSTVVNYLLPYVEGSGGVMFRILRAIILLENENDPYRNTLDFRMITELAKDPELRSFNTDYSELLNIRTKFHTNQDFFDYIKQSLRIVWNSQRTKCILVGFVYVATIEVCTNAIICLINFDKIENICINLRRHYQNMTKDGKLYKIYYYKRNVTWLFCLVKTIKTKM